ncbi:RhsIA family immunity protein [Leptospira sp. 2 VSF19]|uniref:RhsIA family immunity protein n=1 Tax=Leptospira soteropolitanensis TaxID=2950025 RepID=A0AAW5VQ10_9LEPT|nr:NTF2 fold immunity protein [Leptospira soteropolitanensis]MCW7494681.1 RhsIA family immunity protein [Leptospira soteropolitanensis]MCW7502260.1 RhsIA family immunity protein [Leptospira soteropolitanensis]MCW7524505.1 RhsIA family immunity protein [Leptospira soteropolitanensis]MCW7528386.1 RhsIA family immunity protein [Leptospira soteropolitanensis]MCW7532215.1 RhsIA family immunity protein [Leptospira soteropolitanensis]
MEANTPTSAAESRLLAFMEDMHQWETSLIDAQKSSGGTYFDANKDALRASLQGIYQTHLTPKERKNGRVAALNSGTPLAYNPSVQKITTSEILTPNKKVVIETVYPTFMEFRRRYTLVFSNDRWLLDKREDFSPLKGKWTSVTL